MTATISDLILAAETYVRAEMTGEATGHDWWHVHRVRKTAVTLAEWEGADRTVVELAALLHDILDEKFSGSATAGPEFALRFLTDLGADQALAQHVHDIIAGVSFKGAGVPDVMLTLEGNCVRDADRLDAIGAIGIARTFAYGGSKGRPIYDPDIPELHAATAEEYRAHQGTTVNHFKEKLMGLEERMTTLAGARLARERTRFMKEYLMQFHTEWDGLR